MIYFPVASPGAIHTPDNLDGTSDYFRLRSSVEMTATYNTFNFKSFHLRSMQPDKSNPDADDLDSVAVVGPTILVIAEGASAAKFRRRGNQALLGHTKANRMNLPLECAIFMITFGSKENGGKV